MGLLTFLCRNADERERLLDMSRRLRPAKTRSVVLLALAAAVSIPVYGWTMQIPFLLSIAAFGAVQLRLERLRRPGLALAGVWLLAQLAIVVAISLSDGPPIYTISILVFPMLMAAAVFPPRVVAAGTAITVGLMVSVGLGLAGAAVAALPPVLIVPVTVLLEVTLLASRTVEADEAARRSAVVDQLTGLLNRSALQARAAELSVHLSRPDAPPVAVILADIDLFKAVNDEHGHAVGDEVLGEVARRLNRIVGQHGSLYRYGGEEFVVLLEGQAATDAPELAERMRRALVGEPVAGQKLTLSLGVTCSSSAGMDCTRLVACADRALYRAKTSGRDRVCVMAPGAPDPDTSDLPGSEVTSLDFERRLGPDQSVISQLAAGGGDAPTSDLLGMRALGRLQRWLSVSAAEREHMLDIIERVTKIGQIGDPLALAALLAAGPWLGWVPLIPVVASIAVMQLVHTLVLPRVRRTDFVALGGALVAQVGAGLYILLARHPLLGLPLLTILIFPGAAAAPAPMVLLQTLLVGAVMTTAAMLVGAHEVIANPSILVLPLALLGSVAMFGYAIGQSTVAHRTAATVDALTGMLSRAALRLRVAELSHRGDAVGEPVAMLIADLDHFKSINDEHGHAKGDSVLADVADRLRGGLRAFDSMYRIGGEEFMSLLVGLDEDEAVVVAERLRKAVRERTSGGLEVTVSIGVASCPRDVRFDYERLFAVADQALLAAKAGGRDRVLAGRETGHDTVAA